MKNIFIPLFLVATLSAQPVAVDGTALEAALTKGIIEFTKDGKGPTAEALIASLKEIPKTLTLPIPEAAKTDTPEASIFIISTVYDCGDCDNWHPGGTASAWVLSEDGLMVSNYHVFKEAVGAAMGVCDKDGKVHRVTEILAADKLNDIAIFRVDAKGLKPLRIGPPAAIGDEVKVISHPERLFFSHTFGRVSRYHKVGKETQMSITADFAIGSSGAPVLDTDNRVVGMVVSTSHIYADAEGEKGLQMVVKNTVPASAIATMLAGAGQTD